MDNSHTAPPNSVASYHVYTTPELSDHDTLQKVVDELQRLTEVVGSLVDMLSQEQA